MAIYVNGTQIYLFGEQHGNTANAIRQKSWEKYKRGEIEYLCEGSPPLESREDFNRQQQFMIDSDYLIHLHYSFKKSQILFFIASAGEEMYQENKNQLKAIQTFNNDENMIDLPDSSTHGIEEAKKLFYPHWKSFTDMAAPPKDVTGLEFIEAFVFYFVLSRNIQIDLEDTSEKDKFENFEVFQQFDVILNQLRNLHMAQKIANKYKQSKKDVYVHLGELHRIPVETILRNFYQISKKVLQSKFLTETRTLNPWEYK